MTATATADAIDRSKVVSGRDRRRRRPVLTGAEVVLGVAAVLVDRGIPTFVLLVLAATSLLVRHAGLASLGLRRPAPRVRWFVAKMFAFAAAWSLFQLSVTMPLANHVSGHRQDLSDFKDIQGNVGVLAGFLVLSWTLAAIGEELAYRGFLQTRMRQLLGDGKAAVVVAVLASSLLFGLVHSEQGAVGVAIVTLDAIAWSILRFRYRSLWASVLVHGFNNTIGFVAFFLVGPIYGFW